MLKEDLGKRWIALVQLGGLEPPTSCSTDRRSNQLSYNCILRRGPCNRGGRMGRKLGATPVFGKAGAVTNWAIRTPQRRQKTKSPGHVSRAFQGRERYRLRRLAGTVSTRWS